MLTDFLRTPSSFSDYPRGFAFNQAGHAGVGMLLALAGVPVPETMQLLDTMVNEHERTRDRVTALERRLKALDGVSVLRGQS